MHEANKNNYG